MPSPTGPISGLHAQAVTVVSASTATIHALGKWSINPKAESSETPHSGSQVAIERVAGNDSWDGTVMGYGDVPFAWPGTNFTFSGTIDPASPSVVGYSGLAIVDEFSIKIDVAGGKEIGYDLKFSGQGVLTPSTSLSLSPDSVVTTIRNAIGCRCRVSVIDGKTDWEDVDLTIASSPNPPLLLDVTSMDLTIKTANKPYNSSETNGHTMHLPGNLDVGCNIALLVQGAVGFTTLPANNSVYAVRIYTYYDPNRGTKADRFWEIGWILFGGKSNIDVDRKSDNPIGCTLNGALKVVGGTTPKLGWIKDPAGTLRWGTTP